ncbi:MAG: hypothetical protein Q8O89_04245 [Nanoarchaeota archaeon]|nr:hypothetical protein [Nanoarchaeota archaeon]
MVMFSKFLNMIDKNVPYKELQTFYSELNVISSKLHDEIKVLREIQHALIQSNLKKSKGFSGALSIEKTAFLEEHLLPKLKRIVFLSERNFLLIERDVHRAEPLGPDEIVEMNKIMNYLKLLESHLIKAERLKDKQLGDREKLNIVDSCLREITELSRKFYEEQRYAKDLMKKVLEREISPLLQNLYLKPEVSAQGLHIFRVTEKELREIEAESHRINSCRDPNYRIVWRRWWRDIQVPEIDKKTSMKDPHLDITLKLFGQQKKDVHLILKAA